MAVKTHHKIIMILGIVTLGLLSAKAYRDYLEVESTYRVVILEESKSLANLLLSMRHVYQQSFINDKTLLDDKTHQFLPIIKQKAISEHFKSIDGGGREIRVISKNPRNPHNSPNEIETKGLDYFLSNPDKETFFDLSGSQYTYMVPLVASDLCLNCHGKRLDAPVFMRNYESGWNYKKVT